MAARLVAYRSFSVLGEQFFAQQLSQPPWGVSIQDFCTWCRVARSYRNAESDQCSSGEFEGRQDPSAEGIDLRGIHAAHTRNKHRILVEMSVSTSCGHRSETGLVHAQRNILDDECPRGVDLTMRTSSPIRKMFIGRNIPGSMNAMTSRGTHTAGYALPLRDLLAAFGRVLLVESVHGIKNLRLRWVH